MIRGPHWWGETALAQFQIWLKPDLAWYAMKKLPLDQTESYDLTLVSKTIQEKRARILEMLLRRGVNINFTFVHDTFLSLAARKGNLTIVNQLLDAKADPALNHNVAIRRAAEYGHLPIVELLLAYPRVDPNDFETSETIAGTALNLANQNYHKDIVLRLLQDPRVNPNYLHGESDPDIAAAVLRHPRYHPPRNMRRHRTIR